jgi:glycosyltransferase involved in cell wall biosynthesis
MVSIIIPNYNHARFLEERIKSVLNQTYQDFEVIILDDCSTDNSLEIINRYKSHPKVSKIVVNEKNSGSPFKQWHKGIELASHEMIWIAESDDTCEPTFLETLVRNHTENNTVLSFCKSLLVDETGIVMENHFQHNLTDDFILDGKDFICQHLVGKMTIQNISSAIFNKKTAANISTDYTNYRYAGDWLFATELTQKGKVGFVCSPLNYRREHMANATTKGRQSGNVLIEEKMIYDYFLQHGFLSSKKYKWYRKDILRQIHILGYKGETKKQLLTIWNASAKERLWIDLLFITDFLRKIKRILLKGNNNK